MHRLSIRPIPILALLGGCAVAARRVKEALGRHQGRHSLALRLRYRQFSMRKFILPPVTLLLGACSMTWHRTEPASAERIRAASGPADTAVLVVAPYGIGGFESFRDFRDEPNNVSLIGKVEYHLRLIDINTYEFPRTEFEAVRAGFARLNVPGDSDWVSLSTRLGGGTRPVIYVHGLHTTHKKPASLKVQDMIYNCTVAPLLLVSQLGTLPYGGGLQGWGRFARNTVVYTHEIQVRVYLPRENRLSPPNRSQYVVRTELGRLNRTRDGDIEEAHLKALFAKLF